MNPEERGLVNNCDMKRIETGKRALKMFKREMREGSESQRHFHLTPVKYGHFNVTHIVISKHIKERSVDCRVGS